MKVNIGCGNKKIDGVIGVDKFLCDGADIICNIEKEELPFQDDTVEYILLDNVIEHITDIPKLFIELTRIAKDGCLIKIITPHYSSHTSWNDPTHFHHLSYFSFDYFARKEVSHYIRSVIEIKEKKLSFSGGAFGLIGRFFFKISPVFYEKKLSFLFRASTVTVVLKIKKAID